MREGRGVKEKGGKGVGRTGEKTEGRGKGVPLIALCDKYHPGYNFNNRKKTLVYHTVNGDHALFHTSKTAKMIKVILLSSTLTF